jgi:hypothetical protein
MSKLADLPKLADIPQSAAVELAVSLDIPVPLRVLYPLVPRATQHLLRKQGLKVITVKHMGVCVRPSELKRFMEDLVSRSSSDPDRRMQVIAEINRRRGRIDAVVEPEPASPVVSKRTPVVVFPSPASSS